jgi:coenzyme F420-0:L-glutamate ligase/coenzyme F420-1:gamma-L-glutamate ligase
MIRLEVLAVQGIPDVTPGADVARLIVEAATWLRDGDVLVVTSKIVSKAEGRLVELPQDGRQREAAREALLRQESAREVARRGHTRIVQTHHGFVMASAGIDNSNVEPTKLVLLPVDPDASARRLRHELRQRYGLDVAVIVSDTMGRPWRSGLTDVALGVAGLTPVRDYRGETDAYGNELHMTQVAVADELCAAAELVKGKYDQVPVAVVRGLDVTGQPDGPGGAALIRIGETDMFSLGTAEAWASGHFDAASLADIVDGVSTDVPAALVRARALAAAAEPAVARLDLLDERVVEKVAGLLGLVDAGAAALLTAQPAASPPALLATGEWLHRIRVGLTGQGVAHRSIPVTDEVAALTAPDNGWLPLNLLVFSSAP